MVIVLLKFSDNKSDASLHMSAHNQWLKQGIDEGVFLLAGSLKPALGGVILVNRLDRAEAEARIAEDPFVMHGVVTPEYLEVSPAIANESLSFLL